jgi:hypothetical protein
MLPSSTTIFEGRGMKERMKERVEVSGGRRVEKKHGGRRGNLFSLAGRSSAWEEVDFSEGSRTPAFSRMASTAAAASETT